MAIPDLYLKTATIAVSGTQSTAVDLEHYDTFQIQFPTLDSTTVVVSGSLDGTAFYPVLSQALVNELSLAASTGNFILDQTDCERFAGCKAIKFGCGSPQNSGARTITVRFKAPPRGSRHS